MYQIALVIFRECMEIAILLAMFAATARHIQGFGYYLVAGIMLGVVGAGLLGFFAQSLSESMDGLGDEVFDSILIISTLIMIIWTIVWMKNHSKKIKRSIYSVTDQIIEGQLPKWIFTLLVASTIFREGAEIVLIVQSISSIEHKEVKDYLAGLGLGLFSGTFCGIAIYYGLFKFVSRYIFSISTFFMTFIAAGLAAEAAKLLTSIGAITTWTKPLWDSSYLIADQSLAGKFSKIIFGYTAKPSGVEILFYFGTISIIMILSKIFAGKKS